MAKTLLTVAGFDPSGGAGVLLDVAVFRRHGFRGAAVITALTVQDTSAVRATRPVPSAFLRRQWDVVRTDIGIAGVKIGMAGSAGAWAEIRRGLLRQPGVPVVVDPVLWASSGAALSGRATRELILSALRGLPAVLTPNLGEAAFLAGRPVRDPEAMASAARTIFDRTGCPCLVKGGHLEVEAVDVLYDGSSLWRFRHARLARDVHGTGCFLSATLLARLAGGDSLGAACTEAVRRTVRAIRGGSRPGRGRYVLQP
jgi:hydroxymethylpyrimidine/phosphomethylpyrimidine kinase